MKKIFFTDLDGTLLTKNKLITDVTHHAIREWTANGNIFVLCSGRANDSVLNVKETLGLDFPGMYTVGCNGGEIYDCAANKVIYRCPLTFDQVTLVINKAVEMNVYCQTYTDTHIITPFETEELNYYRRYIHTPYIICKDVLSALDKEPCKCIAIEIHNKEKLEAFRQALLPLANGELTLLFSSDKYLEIFPSISGKGTAVTRLCELLDIPIKNSFAAGDEANDISMLQAAGCGIAMLNAKDDVKKTADIITQTDNDHDGLAEILLNNL